VGLGKPRRPGPWEGASGALAPTRGPGADQDYAEDEPFGVAGFTIVAQRLPHYTLLTFGLRVSNGSCSLAYSGDCGPDHALADLARDADLFVCEATLERGELDGRPRGHLSADEAVSAFRESGARRLLITHRPGELPLEDGLERASDGLVIEIG
jgi:ribonuclease BN (tRNA processing enzyme)